MTKAALALATALTFMLLLDIQIMPLATYLVGRAEQLDHANDVFVRLQIDNLDIRLVQFIVHVLQHQRRISLERHRRNRASPTRLIVPRLHNDIGRHRAAHRRYVKPRVEPRDILRPQQRLERLGRIDNERVMHSLPGGWMFQPRIHAGKRAAHKISTPKSCSPL